MKCLSYVSPPEYEGIVQLRTVFKQTNFFVSFLVEIVFTTTVQCSSDISELRIRVLYACILCICICLYARICPFVMHSHKFLYMKHCWSNKGHMGMKRLQSEICIFHISSFRSRKFVDRFFDSCLILSFQIWEEN